MTSQKRSYACDKRRYSNIRISKIQSHYAAVNKIVVVVSAYVKLLIDLRAKILAKY